VIVSVNSMWNCKNKKAVQLQQIQSSLDEIKSMIEQTHPHLGAKAVNPLYLEKTLEKLTKIQEQHEKNLEDITKIPDLVARVEALETIIKGLNKTQEDIQECVKCMCESNEKFQETPQQKSQEKQEGLKIRQPSLYPKPPSKIESSTQSN
jgi:chromosome segregation ATPase